MGALPFQFSPAAQDWLSRLPDKAGEELGFVCLPCYRMSHESEVIEAFDREHFAFVHARPEVWLNDRAATRLAVCDRAFWLTPDILQRLAGKMLEVIRVDIGQGTHAGRFREFLVASSYESKA